MFDRIDQTNYMSSATLCKSLYKMFDILRARGKSELVQVLEYSYLLSMMTFNNVNEALEFG